MSDYGTCASCRHWLGEDGDRLGECRAHPPQLYVTDEAVECDWPDSPSEGVCGAYSSQADAKPPRPSETPSSTSEVAARICEECGAGDVPERQGRAWFLHGAMVCPASNVLELDVRAEGDG